MFASSVRSMGGSRMRVDLLPETAISELRAQLEDDLPPLHEVRLFQGTQEVVDGSQVEGEVQAVSMKSMDKALAELSRLTQSGADDATPSDNQQSAFAAAATVVVEMQDLDPAHCDKLLALLVSRGGCEKYHWNIGTSLSVAFAHGCGDPAPYITQLTETMSDHNSSSTRRMSGLAALVLAEIAERHADAHAALRIEVAEWATQQLSTAVRYVLHFNLDTDALGSACCMLAQFGEVTHKQLLHSILDSDRVRERYANIHPQANSALLLIHARELASDALSSDPAPARLELERQV